MKKALTILMLIALILVGGATADAKTKKKSKASGAKQSSGLIAKFTYNGDSWGLKKDGNVTHKINGKDWESGKYVKDNSGYILVYGYGDNPQLVGIIYKDTLYYVGTTSEIGNVNTGNTIADYFASNLYDDHNCIKKVITFNPATESIKFKGNQGWRELNLSSVPAKDRYKVTWTK